MYMGSIGDDDFKFFTNYGDLQLIPEVVRYPHFEVPYPNSNGDNNI